MQLLAFYYLTTVLFLLCSVFSLSIPLFSPYHSFHLFFFIPSLFVSTSLYVYPLLSPFFSFSLLFLSSFDSSLYFISLSFHLPPLKHALYLSAFFFVPSLSSLKYYSQKEYFHDVSREKKKRRRFYF